MTRRHERTTISARRAKVIPLAHGFTLKFIIELVGAGLATAQAERVVARLRPKRSSLASHQIELLYFVCGATADVDASDVSNFAQLSSPAPTR